MDPTVVHALRPFLSGAEDTFATVLVAGLMRLYGADVLNWDPATVEIAVRSDLETELDSEAARQIQALSCALTSQEFYQDVVTFDRCVVALNQMQDQHHDCPGVDQVAWAVLEVLLNDHGDHQWSESVKRYCGVVLDDEGVQDPPQVLAFAEQRPRQLEGQDDPEAFSAVLKSRQETQQGIEEVLQQRLQVLLEHMERIGVKVDLSQVLGAENPA